uniref:Uncharacterized protein n=1 Tax=Lotharella globosa TaxID=91324 RepID=A0A7S3Y914_9EUKA
MQVEAILACDENRKVVVKKRRLMSCRQLTTHARASAKTSDSSGVLMNLKTERYNHHIVHIEGLAPGSNVDKGAEARYIVKLGTDKRILVRAMNIGSLPVNLDDPSKKCCFGGYAEGEVHSGLDSCLSWPSSITNLVLSYLVVKQAQMGDVKVLGSSSSANPGSFYSFHPRSTIEPGTETCWISREGTCENGIAHEHVMYSFGDVPRLVSAVAMRIPSDGPLSVQKFHLEVPNLENTTGTPKVHPRLQAKGGEGARQEGGGLDTKENLVWKRATPDFQMIRGPSGTHPMQEFLVEPAITCNLLRVVCTKNMQVSNLPH